MANIKVCELSDTITISSGNQLMVLTNDQSNIVQNITIEDFNTNIISSDADNGITQGTDGNLYVDNSDSGVTAGTYQYPQNLVVDSKGKITSVTAGSAQQLAPATTSEIGGVIVGGGISVDANGKISAILRNIGEVVTSSLPLTDSGLHLLDGSLLQYGSYKDFIDYIADLYGSGNYPDLFETEANWQSAVTTYGVCGKFVYDSINNTVRLPKITGIIEGTTDVTALGDLVEAGLPNIIGSIPAQNIANVTLTGAFNKSGSASTGAFSTGGTLLQQLDFDASRSSSIYGNSNTVQPQTIKVLYYIVVATTTKTEIEVDIDEIATDLNGKADVDLSNINAGQSARNSIALWSFPDYANSVDQTASWGTNITAPSNGWVYVKDTYNNTTPINFTVNSQTIISTVSGITSGVTFAEMFPVAAGDIYNASGGTASNRGLGFIPIKGV